jgi:hypothetical protein
MCTVDIGNGNDCRGRCPTHWHYCNCNVGAPPEAANAAHTLWIPQARQSGERAVHT